MRDFKKQVMQIELAKSDSAELIIQFFDKYLDKNNSAIISREFFCPLGIKAAINRNQIMICLKNNEIRAAVRFYPRKRDQIVSIYQFAIAEKFRGKKLLLKMLEQTGYKNFEIICPIDSDFNAYYKKTGWVISKQKNQQNYWSLVL